MSAWQLTPTHIAAVAGTYVSRVDAANPDWTVPPDVLMADARLVADILATENAKSVNHRYNGNRDPVDVPDALLAQFLASPLDDRQFNTAVNCYDYQACEHRGYASSKAFEHVEEMLKLVPKGVRERDDYDSDCWGIPDGFVAGGAA